MVKKQTQIDITDYLKCSDGDVLVMVTEAREGEMFSRLMTTDGKEIYRTEV